MKVYIIGTGPGDPELLTLKAARIIGECDVVVYDDLIPHAILALAKQDAKKVYVGKRGGKPHIKQDEINKILIDLAQKGHSVARLKGGDPFIFGRGGEEALFLKKHNIDFEVIPGITSAIAAPTEAGIPATHRGLASSFSIITAHEDPTKDETSLNWSVIARQTGTLTFLMGASKIASIAESLMKHGMDKKMPCALIEDATSGVSRHVISTLKDVGALSIKKKISSPCVMLVGKVANLSKKLYKSKDLALKGKTILITRPHHLAWETSLLFSALGAKTFVYPLVEIKPIKFPLPKIEGYNMFIFTSQNAVDIFMEKMIASKLDARAFANKEIWAIGPKTQKALKRYGIIADGMASEFRAEGIVKKLASKNLRDMRICLPRALEARPYLVDELTEKGAKVDEIWVYETILPGQADENEFRDILDKVNTVLFTSPSGVKNAVSLLKDDAKTVFSEKITVAIGPVTSACMEELGMHPTLIAKTYTDEGMIEALKGLQT
jgi:uroporphyrinogen III methyltransferase/synthase